MVIHKPIFNAKERRTIEALCNTLIPSFKNEAEAGSPLYFGADDLKVADLVIETLEQLPNPEDLTQIRLFLKLIDNQVANIAIAGTVRSFSNMNPLQREQYLFKLATHKVSALRSGFKVFKALTATGFFGTPQFGERPNPTWEIIGYPGALFPPPEKPKTIKPVEISRHTLLSCDVVVVGSGAGGGVVAGELAKAGLDVIVLEKGGYYNEADFNQVESELLGKLYLDGGKTATRDQGVAILSGSCLGGGTVINYTTSFATPEAVRREWDSLSGFKVFDTPEYEQSNRAVHDKLGISTKYNRLSGRDTVLHRGLEKLGWHKDLMPRNVRGCSQEDDCGYCIYGCQNGAKQSTLITWLEDANQHGARFIVNCTADIILTEKGRASGVVATVTNPESGERYNLTVKAKAVVAACGSLHTPALLLRSKLGGAAVGKNLRLHPVGVVMARMEEEVRPWTGVMQAGYSTQFANLDGKGYGAIFETAPGHLATPSYIFGWENGLSFKKMVGNLKHTAYIGVLLRDHDGGDVRLNKHGQPSFNYRLSKYDAANMRLATEGAIQVLEAAGAKEIYSVQTVPVKYEPGKLGQTRQHFMEEIDRRGWGANQTTYISFHQMGSCRMGSDPARSVINQHNEAHTTPGLFITDASTFPTASGVNPMITIETIAHRAAQYIKSII
ncbi:MAG: GMC family oxidoreductase N-terminal domain-containing protein [Chloroflexi bacterium]|uniref:long-chain-alcohol oxidase n=1 Tax=Candidatus Chlorohelix allophototropha TaxID=3003348 RepID=A0A8T7LWY9_9CHLR|nr:GMC family oxidoreductase N-terminal domain-containing protein [Chloroflexota bacterium]WJW67356.1 GMC family oxidoreductase N-terminal domain-containing protein [Chloroflexota bacterium L227-S17]